MPAIAKQYLKTLTVVVFLVNRDSNRKLTSRTPTTLIGTTSSAGPS
jgi:hypothetical protein